MICENCIAVNPIPKCTEHLSIGFTDLQNVTVWVVIKNLTNNSIKFLDGIVDNDGELTVDTSTFTFSPNYTYRLHVVTAASADDQPETVTLQLGDYEITNCIVFEVEDIDTGLIDNPYLMYAKFTTND